MIRRIVIGIAAALIVAPAYAQQTGPDKKSGTEAPQAAAMSEGEVRKVDKETKKITIKHGPLQNLDMPAMTMVFQVKEPAMLDQVKVGDKVKFQAEKLGGAFTITKLEPAN